MARLLEAVTARRRSADATIAILSLLSRLGLRACEVAVLGLDDVDWRTGELTVRGKGSQTDRLPLPHDVGQALAEHLLARVAGMGVARCSCARSLRTARCQPHAIDAVVRHACDRAGVARVGTHRLRHTVATELLRAGAALTEIAPVLRHTNLSTTAIYAKVDRATLRTLARPWPLREPWRERDPPGRRGLPADAPRAGLQA